MKISLPLDPPTEIDLAEEASPIDIGIALAENDVVKELCLRAARNSYFEAWTSDRDMDNSTALSIARLYVDGGIAAVADHAIENDWDNPVEDGLDHLQKDSLASVLRPALNALEPTFEVLEYARDEVIDELVERLRDDLLEAMSEADKSSIEDMVPSHTVVEIAFVPDLRTHSLDELFTTHDGICSDPATVVPNASFLRFLRLVNWSVGEYVDLLREGGDDLLSPPIPEGTSDYAAENIRRRALEWRAALDVERGTHEAIRQLPLVSKYEIAEWNERVDIIRTMRDFDRPRAVEPKTLLTILDEASYGGVPSFICRLPLRDLLKGEFDRPFLAEGGFVGLHHFYNGSGYIERPAAPIVIDPSKGAFHVHSTRKNAVDDVYYIVGSYYRVETTPFEAPRWQRVKEGAWYRAGEHGSVEITMSRDESGAVEYLVQSFDANGLAAGARETAEVFHDLLLAEEEGDRVLSLPTSDPYPAP